MIALLCHGCSNICSQITTQNKSHAEETLCIIFEKTHKIKYYNF